MAENRAEQLNLFLQFDERDILQDNGKIIRKITRDYAETEFEKYRIVQDRLIQQQTKKGKPK